MAVIRNRRIGEEIVGWVAACFLIVLLLPLLGMLYFDILEAKHEVKVQVEKVEKMTRKTGKKDMVTYSCSAKISGTASDASNL